MKLVENIYLKGFFIGSNFEEEYLYQIPAIKYLKEFTFSKPVTFLVGENGTGKSTLLEALAVNCGFNPEGGSRYINFSSMETHSSLHRNIKTIRSIPFAREGFFLRAESFYNVATALEEVAASGLSGELGREEFFASNYGGKSLHEQSHGESFLALALNRFHGNSIFFLDEPEAALSPARQMALLLRINELVQEKSQFIIATHSPMLMAYPKAEIIQLKENSATITPYEETEHYLLTKQFMDNPKQMLHYLLGEV